MMILKTFLTRSLPSHCSIDALKVSVRFKHSNTQVKRLFNKNGARMRLMGRKSAVQLNYEPTLNSMLVEKVSVLPNGWVPPPPEEVLESVAAYPFQVSRTGNKPNGAVGFLPGMSFRVFNIFNWQVIWVNIWSHFYVTVYSDYRGGGRTKHTTIVRKVRGDIDLFVKELLSHLNSTEGVNLSPQDVRIRAGNVIEIKGTFVHEVRLWLAGLGF